MQKPMINPSKTHACCKRMKIIYDASGSPIAVDATNYSLCFVFNFGGSKDSDNPDYVTDVNKTAVFQNTFLYLKKKLQIVKSKDVSVRACFSGKTCRFKIRKDLKRKTSWSSSQKVQLVSHLMESLCFCI